MKNSRLWKKFIAAGLAATVAVGSLTACGDANASADNTGKDTQAAGDNAEANTIRFGIAPGTIRTALVILANELGYYEEEGVNVELVEVADATSALTSLSTGKNDIDVWGTGIVPDLTFIANGSDLVIFEGTAAEGGCIISRPEDADTYKALDNLEGTTVAMVRGESSWVVTRAYLLDNGYDVNTIEIKEVDSQANVAQAVAKGEADLGFLPIEFANSYAEIGIEIVKDVAEISPLYVCCRQVTSSDKLDEKKAAFVKFTKANLRAWEYFSDEGNKDEVIASLAEYSGQTEEYVENYIYINSTTLTLDPNASGVETYFNSLVDSGFFADGTDVDITEHIDTTVYKTALDELAEANPDNSFYQDLLTTYAQYNE